MNDKQYTETMTDIEMAKQLNALSGISYNDALAMLTQIDEVQTVDEIPLDPLRRNSQVDSSPRKLNRAPDSIQLDRNAPRET